MNFPVVFPLNESTIRTVVKNEKTWYCLKDVCQALTITNHRNKVKHLKNRHMDDVQFLDATGKRKQKTKFITLAGVMCVIRHTTKESELCDAFMEWLTEEVAPQLLTKGVFEMHKAEIDDLTRRMNEATVRANGLSIQQQQLDMQAIQMVHERYPNDARMQGYAAEKLASLLDDNALPGPKLLTVSEVVERNGVKKTLVRQKRNALGRRVAERWRSEGRGEPRTTKKQLNTGHVADIKIYPETYSNVIMEEWAILLTDERELKQQKEREARRRFISTFSAL